MKKLKADLIQGIPVITQFRNIHFSVSYLYENIKIYKTITLHLALDVFKPLKEKYRLCVRTVLRRLMISVSGNNAEKNV